MTVGDRVSQRRRKVAILAALLAAVGCDGGLDRPIVSPEIRFVGIDVELRILTIPAGEPALAGERVEFRVAAVEPGGELRGIGYVIRRPGPNPATLDSVLLSVSPTTISEQVYVFTVPDDLQPLAQIDFVGLARGPGEVFERSPPQSVVVIRCEAHSTWC